MKRDFQSFEPPAEIHLTEDKEISLLIKGAIFDGRGGTVVSLEVWNGTLKHADRVNLTRDQDRKRFVKAASEAEPKVPLAVLQQKLLEAAGTVPGLLFAADKQEQAAAAEVDVDSLWERAKPLATNPELLTVVLDTIKALGLVGERKNAGLLYLAATARLLPKPVNVFTKGPSGSGKSFSQECVLKLLPKSAYEDYSAVSPRYLAYSDDDLRHKIVVIHEAAGLEDGTGAYIIRSLLSEGRLKLGTVDKDDGGSIGARGVTKEGPTALFTTTCRASLDAELETRALSIFTTDTQEQSRKIITGIAKAAEGMAPEQPDLEPFHAFQEWLQVAGERRVIIPYASVLARLVKCQAIRIRRDFRTMVSLIQACAILHQMNRQRSVDGAILASPCDYKIVRDAMADYFSAAQQDGLTEAQRKAVEAVRELCEEQCTSGGGVSLKQVAVRLGLDKSAASRRLANPLREGYLKNLETRKGHAAAYAPGEPLPEPVSALPIPEELRDEWGRASCQEAAGEALQWG